MSLLLLFACGPAPSWTYDGALAPTYARMDLDGDGRVVEAEYVRLALAGPAFERVDLDRDGLLSTEELDRLVFLQDPLSFDGANERQSWGEVDQTETTHPDGFERRSLRDLFRSLAEAIRAVDPGAELPDEATIEAAARTRRLESFESRALLLALAQAADDAGAGFPERLRPAPLPGEAP